MSRLPSLAEQAFLLKLSDLIVGRRGFGLSFEVDGPRLCLEVHPPYALPAHVSLVVESARLARTSFGNLTTVHDVATRLVARVQRGLG